MGGEEEGEDRIGICGVMGDEEPRASTCLLLTGRGGCKVGGFGLGEDGDAAGARAGGEIRRVGIERVEKWDYGCV